MNATPTPTRRLKTLASLLLGSLALGSLGTLAAGCSSGGGGSGSESVSSPTTPAAGGTGSTSGSTSGSTGGASSGPAGSSGGGGTPPPFSGQAYYVSNGGDDSSAGTQGAPFLTLQQAANVAVAGDQVRVEDGTYAGFYAVNSGSAGAPIVYFALGPNVVIDRPNALSSDRGIDLRQPSSPLSDVVIDGFVIDGVPAQGVKLSWTTRIVVRNCTVRNCGNVGVNGGHTTDVLVENNTISGNGSHGVYISNSSTGATIRSNVIRDNATAGIHHNGDVRYLPGDGIIHFSTIENNLIHDNGQNGINWDGVQDSTVRNNFIYGNASNGIRAFGPPNGAADSAEGPKNNVFVNNTIVVPASGGWCIRITDDLGNNVAFNNVLIHEGSGGGSLSLDNTTGFASANNALTGRLSLDRGNTILSLADWQAAGYGQDSFEASSAQLFVAPASGDYHLAAGAPAIDAGTASFSGNTAPSTDNGGNARPQGAAHDAGAHERP